MTSARSIVLFSASSALTANIPHCVTSLVPKTTLYMLIRRTVELHDERATGENIYHSVFREGRRKTLALLVYHGKTEEV